MGFIPEKPSYFTLKNLHMQTKKVLGFIGTKWKLVYCDNIGYRKDN